MAVLFFILLCQSISRADYYNPLAIAMVTFDSIKDHQMPKGWWVEGGQNVGVESGYLRIKADPLIGSGKWCTVWTPIVVSKNVQISYDAHILSSRKNRNNINLFLFYSDPSGKNLHETRALRESAEYSLYHGLKGYIITFVKGEKDDARIRIRRCPGFKLLKEGNGYHCRRGNTYHFTVTKNKHEIIFDVDNGKYSLSAEDQSPLFIGRIGFRTYRTDYWIDNLKVTALPD